MRYLVWIEGTTQRSDESGTLQCTVVSGGIPACFGFLSWENGSNYEASVWDVHQGMSVGTLSSEASGTSFVPAVVVPRALHRPRPPGRVQQALRPDQGVSWGRRPDHGSEDALPAPRPSSATAPRRTTP